MHILRRVATMLALVGLVQVSAGAAVHTGPYLESVHHDAAAGTSSVWVLWEMKRGTGQPVVEFGQDPDALLSVTGTSSNTEKKGRLKTEIHEVRLHPLFPNTIYYYRIKTGANQFSDLYRFLSAPAPAEEAGFTFLATADEQPGSNNSLSNPQIHTGVVEKMIEVHCGTAANCPEQVQLVLSAGDNVDRGGEYDQYKWWFDVRQVLQRYVPQVVAPGNHEYYGDSDLSIWRRYHHNPRNGRISVAFPPTADLPGYRDDHEERWYFIDYSNVRFVSMDSSGYDSGAEVTRDLQNDWLDAVLDDACSQPAVDFVVAQFHHNHTDEWWAQLDATSIGDAVARLQQFSSVCAKPSAHIYGHTHNYNRGQSRDHNHSIINASTAGGSLAWNWQTSAVDYPEVQISDVSYGWVGADVSAGDEPSIRFRRYSVGQDPAPVAWQVIDDFTVTRNSVPPAQPNAQGEVLPTSPADPPYVRLQASAFVDESAPQQASHWQVKRSSDTTFEQPVAEAWEKFENWVNGVDLQAGNDLTDAQITGLEGNTSYDWRVRYRNQNFHWSDWSGARTFTTSGPLGASFQLYKTTYAQDEPVVATFSGGPGNPTDWVGIYSDPGNAPTDCSSNGASTIWLYTNDSQSAGGSLTAGSVTFSSANPAINADPDWPLAGGDYVAYFLESDGYCQLGNPVTFQVESVTSGDTVTITRATYRSKPRRLVVEATSSAAPAAALTLVDYGPMSYNSSTGRYVFSQKVASPGSITVVVVSDQGGSDSAVLEIN